MGKGKGTRVPSFPKHHRTSKYQLTSWSSELKKYVYGDEAEISLGGAKKEDTPIVDPQADDEPSEELPF